MRARPKRSQQWCLKCGGQGSERKMYSIFLPFAAVVVDLCVAYIYFKVGLCSKSPVRDTGRLMYQNLFQVYQSILPFDLHHLDCDHHHPPAQHNWWLGGGTTALIALIPLFIIAFLLYSGWSRLKQVTSSSSPSPWSPSTYFIIFSVTINNKNHRQ